MGELRQLIFEKLNSNLEMFSFQQQKEIFDILGKVDEGDESLFEVGLSSDLFAKALKIVDKEPQALAVMPMISD